jgi:hypothetical protein
MDLTYQAFPTPHMHHAGELNGDLPGGSAPSRTTCRHGREEGRYTSLQFATHRGRRTGYSLHRADFGDLFRCSLMCANDSGLFF